MKIDYWVNFSIDIQEPTLKAITKAYFQLLPILLSDFFKKVIVTFAQYYMERKLKPFSCEECGNREEFIWKTRGGKCMELLTIFGMIKIPQLQVKCKRCGHRMYITRRLLGVEPRKKVPRETVRKLGLLGI